MLPGATVPSSLAGLLAGAKAAEALCAARRRGSPLRPRPPRSSLTTSVLAADWRHTGKSASG